MTILSLNGLGSWFPLMEAHKTCLINIRKTIGKTLTGKQLNILIFSYILDNIKSIPFDLRQSILCIEVPVQE